MTIITVPDPQGAMDAFTRNTALAAELKNLVERSNVVMKQLREDKKVKVRPYIFTNCATGEFRIEIVQDLT